MSTGNPLDSLFAQSNSPEAQTPSTATATPGLPAPEKNPLDAVSENYKNPASQPLAAETPQDIPSLNTPKGPEVNPLDSLSNVFQAHDQSGLTAEEQKQSAPDTNHEENVDEPWYSKTWDWLNKPLWDLHQYGTRTGAGAFERGLESGAEDLISGLTSPLQLAITVATLGGSEVEQVGIGALRSIGVSKLAAPIVIKGLTSAAALGFTGQALTSILTQAPQALDALKDGNYEEFTRIATGITGNVAMLAAAKNHTIENAEYLKSALKGEALTKAQTLATAKKMAGVYDENRIVAEDRGRKMQEDIRQQLEEAGATDPIRQGAIRKYMVANGDMDLLKDQHDALAGALAVRGGKISEAVPNPKVKDFGSQKNFDDYVQQQHGGDVLAAKADLAKQFDAVKIGTTVDPLKPEADMRQSLNFSKDHVYHVAEAANADMIKNAGIKGAVKRNEDGTYENRSKTFYNSPEEALKNAPTPASGNRGDLTSFAVPRDEVVTKGTKVNADGSIESTKQHMPSHHVILDENGVPTGDTIPLRSDSKFHLTLDKTRFESEYSPEDKAKLLEQYKAARNLTPEEKQIADNLRKHYEDSFNFAHANGMIKSAVEAYHPQAWLKDRPGLKEFFFGEHDDRAPFAELRHQTDNGRFDTDVASAKHRAFETEFQGEMAGYKAKTDDLSYHAANHRMAIEKALAARNFIENLRATGARAADGRPLVAMYGSGKVLGAESKNPALMVNPDTPRGIAINDKLIKAMMDSGELQKKMDDGHIESLPYTRDIIDPKTGEKVSAPAYAWSTEGFRTIDHPSMRDWQYIGKDTAGNDAILKGAMRVHPEAADYIKQVVGADTSVFRTNPALKALMAAQREAKGTLLSFSPFHAVQEGLRAMMVGINPLKGAEGKWFNFNPADIENDTKLRLGLRNGLTLSDHRAEDMFSEGNVSHSKIIGKIPVVNKLQNYIQTLTFDKLIPAFKTRAFKSIFDKMQDRMPNASADEVARATSGYVNDVFGGQNWRDLGVSTQSQDVMKSFALAPDWLVSEMRMLGRAAGLMDKASGQIARNDMLKMSAGLFVAARVANMFNTGKAHPEAPFGIVTQDDKGQEKVYSLRTLPGDLIHALSDPANFVKGRVNPLTVRTAIEFITGRDQLGHRAPAEKQAHDFVGNFLPIGVQGFLPGGSPSGMGRMDQAIKAAGATVKTYKTEAEKMADEKAYDRMPSGPVAPEAMAKHLHIMQMEDGLRNGSVSRGEIYRAMPAREAQQVIQQSQMTRLQSRFQRLPLGDALDVYQLATDSEKDQLHSLLWKKRVSYLQSHTGAQRSADPTWEKAQKIFGDLSNK